MKIIFIILSFIPVILGSLHLRPFASHPEANLIQETLSKARSYDRNAIPEIKEADLDQHLYEYFSRPRNHENSDHQHQLWSVRSLIQGTFNALKSDRVVFERHFYNATTGRYGEVLGINYYLTVKGETWGTPQDKIVALCAHYESYRNASGTDNNGSGISALLEIARIIANLPCKFTYSIIFVANDLEEEGSHGINQFIYNYLVPIVLKDGNTPQSPRFQGAFVFETIMNWNETEGSQALPSISGVPPAIVEIVFESCYPTLTTFWRNTTKKAGTWIMPIGRREDERHMYQPFLDEWYAQSSPDPQKYLGHQLGLNWTGVVPPNRLPERPCIRPMLRADWKDFLMYNGSVQLSAVMITDGGDFRGVMQTCYGKPCDNYDQVTPEKLTFLKKTSMVTAHTLLKMSEYHCTAEPTMAPSGGRKLNGAFGLVALMMVGIKVMLQE